MTRVGAMEGWAAFLGVFTDRKLARERLARAGELVREDLSPAPRRMRPALLERELGRGPSWKGLLGGLSREEAGRVCKALWARGWQCVAHSPQRIAMPPPNMSFPSRH